MFFSAVLVQDTARDHYFLYISAIFIVYQGTGGQHMPAK